MERRHFLAAGMTAAAASALHAQDLYRPYRGQKIVVSYPGPHPHYDAAQTLFDRFTSETGILVERDRTPYLDMHDKQVAEMRRQQGGYDVVTYLLTWKNEYARRALLRPLDDMLVGPLAQPGYALQDIIPGYLESIGRVGGPGSYLPRSPAQLYGLPYGAETSVLGYRRDVLERLKLPIPTNYTELLSACEMVRDKEKIGGLASRTSAGHQIVHAWLLHLTPHGGQVFDGNYHAVLQNEAGVRAAEVLARIVQTGPEGLGANAGFGEMQEAFLSGRSAFYLDSLTVMNLAHDPKRSRVAGKVAYAMHPTARTWSGLTGGFGLGVPANARNPEAAFLFIQWLTNKENDLRVAVSGGNAGRWSTLSDAEFRSRRPEQSILPYALKIANPAWRPLIPEWDTMARDVIGQALPDVLSGKRTAAAALAACVAPLDAMVAASDWRKTRTGRAADGDPAAAQHVGAVPAAFSSSSTA
ncbi:extracellular solute-binding protein [Xylophilus ampelinus]|uniref:Carbohydrate ABC transporter substrate-binding protein (CUT1 family) n=1 Tax=Xylophilus ampelinus TaxID=54067 RepID=A0A318SP38_9BURK|nr:extracellular solute-binding protein [Xylophilus ampelinus]MCS4509412.1 extracellular solute-binding protein [Xylophilus ampelinus]PYE79134.1 carbohydrate ABC transporter substrate-binding protein (CUT1 family) [Xylophilus ampelinus]